MFVVLCALKVLEGRALTKKGPDLLLLHAVKCLSNMHWTSQQAPRPLRKEFSGAQDPCETETLSGNSFCFAGRISPREKDLL